ncbi:hypothetical protein [Flavihumibacter petaseus]|uniref:Uncharacterized protein n=1 Tax=Flavihumibacter petaseus NBRC 106054 TaxID=1220578 RepID=A0A0E9MX62_9BACT|nr:hypothetical protein [Flavihumibacter petaseus]GAO42179.1 hypothetical protein FPE01S_01_11920 [Flavihumibacter petaseus NBRC 106054]
MNQTLSPFRQMSLSYRRLLYAKIIFWVIALLVVGFGWVRTSNDVALDRLLQVIAVLYSFIAVMVGLLLFRRKVEGLRTTDIPVRDKLEKYYQAGMIQWILLTSAGFFCGASYLLVGNWAFPVLAIALLAIYGGLNPFKQKVLLQLRLRETDVAGI